MAIEYVSDVIPEKNLRQANVICFASINVFVVIVIIIQLNAFNMDRMRMHVLRPILKGNQKQAPVEFLNKKNLNMPLFQLI